jgi:hypothetical protein
MVHVVDQHEQTLRPGALDEAGPRRVEQRRIPFVAVRDVAEVGREQVRECAERDRAHGGVADTSSGRALSRCAEAQRLLAEARLADSGGSEDEAATDGTVGVPRSELFELRASSS